MFHDHRFFTEDGKPDLSEIEVFTDDKLVASIVGFSNSAGEQLWDDLYSDVKVDGRASVQDNFINALQNAKANGLSREKAIELAQTFKCNVSYTWHPTNNLSEGGTKLRLEQIAAFEDPDPDAVRAKVEIVRQKIKDSKDLTPQQKATMIDEMDANVAIADRDNKGANMTERIWEEGIQQVWGGDRPDLSMNLGGRSWIFDADGKNNNEGWAMIAALTTLKKEMFEQTIEALDDELIAKHPELAELRDDLGKVLNNLNIVNTKARDITDEVAKLPVEEREAYFKAHEEHFKTALVNLRSLYKPVGDSMGDRGHNFYLQTLEKLEAARDIEQCQWDDNSKLDDAYRTLRRNGFTLQKGQTRHNGIVYADMMDQFFAHEEFLNSDFLRDSDRELLRDKGKFTALTDDQQRMMMGYVTKHTRDEGVRKQLQKFLEDAIEHEFDSKNGYPTSAAAMADRLRIRSIFKRNFAEGIISDSGEVSTSHQNFFAKIFGMPGLKSMALNEDKDTLRKQAKLAISFHRADGAEAAIHRKRGQAASYSRGPDNEIRIMIPSSDSMRNGGPGTLLQMVNTIREATHLGIEEGVPIEIMLGSGGSMGRFGCDQAMVRRIVAQVLQEYAQERGRAFDLNDPKDAAAIRMAQVVMHTEQGRMPNIMSATPLQIAMRHLERTTEMLEDTLELTGIVPPGTYIDPIPQLDDATRDKAASLREQMIGNFTDFRFAVSAKDDVSDDKPKGILNAVARKVMFPNLASYINHGARPAAKGSSKEITDVRAIENDKRKQLAEMFDSSFYGAGAMMEELHRSVNSNATPEDRRFNAGSVMALMEQPDWNFFIFAKGVTEAMRFEATKKFTKLVGGDANKWDFDLAVEIGKSVVLEKPEGTGEDDPCIMHFDDKGGTVSEEEAYLAKIYYDRLQFLALTEASLKGELKQDMDKLIQKFRPADGSLEFGPGQKTLEEWPVAQEVYDKHQENADALELMHQLEDYFERRLDEGASKEQVVEELGGEDNIRKICSAYMEGTLAHEPFWTGDYNYGVDMRIEKRLELAANDNRPPEPEERLDAA